LLIGPTNIEADVDGDAPANVTRAAKAARDRAQRAGTGKGPRPTAAPSHAVTAIF